ncbi:MAG: phosphoribosyltransferase [Chlamydiales bacterium]
MIFIDRVDAGRRLAVYLKEYAHNHGGIVIALPRGGVVVGYEVASELNLPLDIVCPRKIGAPLNPELAIGAVTETGESIFNEELVEDLGVSKDFIEKAIETEKKEAARRLDHFRKGRPKRNLENKRVILVDDGLATGATMRAAIKTVRKENAKEIIMAIPVAPVDTISKLENEVDQIVCLATPPSFYAIGQFYDEFSQTTDEEVILLLEKQFSAKS